MAEMLDRGNVSNHLAPVAVLLSQMRGAGKVTLEAGRSNRCLTAPFEP